MGYMGYMAEHVPLSPFENGDSRPLKRPLSIQLIPTTPKESSCKDAPF
jgi:hypothetical protein